LNLRLLSQGGGAEVVIDDQHRAARSVAPRWDMRGLVALEPEKEAVMDDRQNPAERTPQTRRFVTEMEMLELLNRSLWEVERQRAQEHAHPTSE
jgi:hypothetical protein